MSLLLPNTPQSKLVSTKIASEISGYNSDYLARLCREEKIIGVNVGRAWIIDRESLEKFCAEQLEKKQLRARELRAARGREYRLAQKPIQKAAEKAIAAKKAVLADVAPVTPAVTFSHQAIPSPLSRTMGTGTFSRTSRRISPIGYSRPLAATAVALIVVAGSAFASTNSFALRVLATLPEAALALSDAASPTLLTSSSFRVTDERALASETTRDNAFVFALPSARASLATFAGTTGSSAAAFERYVHTLGDNARAPFAETEEGKIAAARIAHVSSIASNPIGSLVNGYVYSGIYAYRASVAVRDGYVAGITESGESALTVAAETRDTIALAPRLTNVVLDNYARGIFAWNDAAPKVAGTIVAAVYDAGEVSSTLALRAPSTARDLKDALAQGAVDSSLVLADTVMEAEMEVLRPLAPASLARVQAGAENASLGFLGKTAAKIESLYAGFNETGTTIASLPLEAEKVVLGTAGFIGSVLDGTEVAAPQATPEVLTATAADVDGEGAARGAESLPAEVEIASSASATAVATNDAALAIGGESLTANVVSFAPTSWHRAFERIFHVSSVLALDIARTSMRAIANLLPGGIVAQPVLTFVDTGSETFLPSVPSDALVRPVGGNGNSGKGDTIVQNIFNSYFPQTILGGGASDELILAIVRPFVNASIESALRDNNRNDDDDDDDDDDGDGGGSGGVNSDGATLTNVTILSGNGTFTNITASSANLGSTTIGTLTTGTTTVNGDLTVNGTITATTLSVSNLSSNAAVIAPYFTATSTNATSTFPNLESTNAAITNLTTNNFGLGGQTFTSLLGTGLTNVGGVLTVSTSSLNFDGTYFKQGGNAFGTPAIIGTTDANPLRLIVNNAVAGTFDVNGFFGLGTTTPAQRLAVAGNALISGGLTSGTLTTGSATVSSLSVGSLTGFLRATAGAVSVGLIDLSTDVSSTLPVANGGTGSSSLSGILVGNGTSPVQSLVVNAPLNFSGNTLSISQAGAASDGYLSAADWNTFNTKFATTSTNYYLSTKTTTDLAEGSNLYYTDARARGSFSFSGTGLTYSSTTGVLAVAAGYTIPLTASTTEWSTAYQNRITSATAPLSITNNVISIAQSSATTSGFLSSADFVTFNNKISSTSLSGGTGISYNSGTGLITNTGVIAIGPVGQTASGTVLLASTTNGTDFSITGAGSTLSFNLPSASATNRGLLTPADFTTFNSKQAALTFTYPLVNSANTVSLAFGTTTANSWSQLQTFNGGATVNGTVTLNSFNGVLYGNNGVVNSIATSSVTNGTGISITGAASVIGAGGLTITNTGVTSIQQSFGTTQTGAITLASSTTGTDFSITNSGSTFSFNLPSASASARGLLTPSDFTTFNAKQAALTFTYPLVNSANTISLAFGTTTANTWSALQTFNGGITTSGTVTLGALNGVLYGNSGVVAAAATSTATLGSEFSYSGTLGSFIGGASGSLTLATNGVALNKLVQIGANTILGNPTGATGDVQAFATSSLGIALSDTTGVLAQNRGGTGFSSYTAGDILYADGSNNLQKLPIGAAGTVLKVQAGLPAWGVDQTTGGGGSDGVFATSSGRIYPLDTSNVLVLGTSATTTNNSIFEVSGNSYFSGNVGIGTTSPAAKLGVTGNVIVSGNITAGGAGTFASLNVGTLNGLLYGNNGAVAAASVTSPLQFSAGTLSITQANSSTNGFLSSADWNTFNNKISSTSLSAVYPLAYNSSTGVFTTAFSTTTANTFSAPQTFNGGVTIGTLNGPLQANNGVVSATSSIGVLYGGTGLTTAPTYGQLLVGNASGGYTLTATSSLGLVTAAVTGIGPAGQIQNGPTITIATTTSTTNGITSTVTVTGTGNTLTFTPSQNGTLTVAGGGTGSTTLGGILIGNGTGAIGSLTVSAPLSYSAGTLSISQASVSTDGFLSSADFTTFNNKISSTSLSGGTGISYNSGTGVITNTGVTSIQQSFGTTQTGAITLASSTNGTDFSITNSGATFTFNLPSASATNRGLLTAADWSTFNAKQAALTFTYPLVNSANTVSLAFGTTTANTWSALQMFNGGITVTGNTLLGNATSTSEFAARLTANTASFGQTGSTTISSAGALTTPSLTIGALNGVLYGSAGAVSASATSTPTLSSELSYSGTLGSFVGGASGALSITTNGVALNKLVQIGANTILGNPTGATGNVQAFATSSLGIALSDTSGTLTVARGGTGSTTLGGILIGNGTSAVGSATISAPLTYSGGTLAITQANTSTNGFLSSADFTTFNNKISSTSLSGGTGISYNSGTGVITNTGVTSIQQSFGSAQTGAITFASSTTGTDFSITNTGSTFSFNLPSASATNRGLLTAADWSTFNNKQSALTGTTGQFPYFSANNTVTATSTLFLAATGNIGIGSTSPYAKLSVAGDLALTGGIFDNNATRGTNGQILQTTGTGVQWVSTTSLGFPGGTVTSVNASGGSTGLSFSGGPITTSGTLTLSGTLGIANGGTNNTTYTTNGVLFYDGTKFTNGTGLTYDGTDATIVGGAFKAPQFLASDSAGAPGFSWANDMSTGMYRQGANLIGFATGGVGRVFIDGSGYLGIGTTSPAQALSVAGNGYITGSLSSLSVSTGNLTATGTTTLGTLSGVLYGNSGVVAASGTSTPTLGLGLSYSGTLGSFVGGASGNLTVATSSLYTGTTGQFPYFSATNTITATSSLFLATSGNVGVGTTNPTGGRLDVNGFINIANNAGYNIGGSLLGYSSSTNEATVYGLGAGGQSATTSATARGLTAIGFKALSGNSTGVFNTAIGNSALAVSTSGSSNTAVGYFSLSSYTGSGNNTGLGASALRNNTVGTDNVAVGTAAMFYSTGAQNTVIGSGALAGLSNTGSTNIVIGYLGAPNLTSGSNNIIIGNNTNAPSATASNQINIGNIIFGTGASGSGNTIAGNIGIGTTSPLARFSVNGDSYLSGNLTATGTINFTGIASGLVASNNGTLYSLATSTNFVTSLTAGTGIGLSGSTGAITISNNGLLSLQQTFGSAQTGAITVASSTAGIDFSITNSGGTFTFNLPSASATARGLLTPADWTTFNNKISSTSLSAVYPLAYNSSTGVFTTAFSTTTANTYSALQTFNGGVTIGSLNGVLYGNNGSVTSAATSTPTLGLGLGYSGTLGSFVGGTSGNLTIATSSLYTGTTGQFPYFSGTNTITATSSIFIAPNGNIGIGTTTTANGRLTISTETDLSALNISALGVTTQAGFSITAPLGDGITAGKAFSVIVPGETFARIMFATNGALGIGPGSSGTRDVWLRRSAANTFAIDSNQSGGAATLTVSGNLGVGTSSPYARLSVGMSSTTDSFVVGTAGSSTPAFIIRSANANGFIGIGTTSPYKTLSVTGDFALTGGFFDSLASAGQNGYVLQSTGSATRWVATSTLGFSSANGTTDQVAYFNGANSLTGSSNFTYDGANLTVAGNILSGAQFVGLGGVGSAGTPSYAFASDLSTGIFHPANNNIGFSTGGVERARLDGNGFFGISTTSPGSLLSIGGVANFTTATSTFYSTGGINLAGGGCFAINGTCLTNNPYTFTYPLVNSANTISLAFGTTTANSWSQLQTFNGGVTTSGTVTLGTLSGVLYGNNGVVAASATSTPTLGLGLGYSGTLGSFVGGSSGSLTIATSSLYTGTTGQFPYFSGTNTISATSSIFIAQNGDIGIGTTTPAANRKLTVYSNNLSVAQLENSSGSMVLGLNSQTGFVQVLKDNLGFFAYTNSGGYFGIDGATNNFGIATNTPGSLLSVQGVANFSTATSSFYSTGGINLTGGGCFAINGVCVGGSSGVTSITPQFGSALTGALTIASSTTGTDFSITSAASTITFNLPSASASARGLLTAADWSTFNNKQAALSFTYPLVNSANTVSLAFGTTTSNTWAGTQTFTNAPVLGSLTGVLYGNNGTLATQATSTATLGLGLSGSLITLGTSNLTIATSSLYTGTTGQFPYFSGTNTITATSSLFLAASGNVGMGTTTPSAKLAIVDGGLTVTRTSNSGAGAQMAIFYNTNNGTNASALALFRAGSTADELAIGQYAAANTNTNFGSINGGYSVFTTSSGLSGLKMGTVGAGDPLIFGTADLERLRIDGSGNVGIGTTTPYGQLSINPDGIVGPAFVIGSSTGTIFTVGNDGNVGIGTTTPNTKLTVNGGSLNVRTSGNGSAGQVAYFTNTTNTTSSYAQLFIRAGVTNDEVSVGQFAPSNTSTNFGSSNGGYGVFTSSTGLSGLKIGTIGSGDPLIFGTADAERLRIDGTTGNIGIGTTTPGSLLSVGGIANFTTATSSFYSTGGINLTGGGCFAINGVCVSGGGGGVTSITPEFGSALTGALTFASSTSGTDFSITGSGATLTFNLPSASATNRGLLTSADWTTFNNKISSTSLSAVYPLAYNSSTGVFTTAFSTTTTNTYSALQTFNGGVTIGSLNGVLYGNNGSVTSAATSTPTLGLGLGYSGTLGSFVGGSSGSLTIATSSLYTGTTGQFPYFSGTNTITATSSIFIRADGNVGIGTTDPTSKFTVSGGQAALSSVFVSTTAEVVGALYAYDQILGTAAGNGSAAAPSYTFSDIASGMYLPSTGNIAFSTGSVERVRINSAGLGFGTTTPWGALSASTTSAAPALAIRQNGAGPAGVFLGGNVGIGTTTPGSLLSVNGIANFTAASSTFYSTGGINLTGGGCFAINGVCVGGAGGVTSLGAQFGSALTGALTIASSTTGTDFSITSAASTITFNLPSASATARGLLTSADWSTFNNKISSTSLSAVYPLAYNSSTGVFTTAFSTTTANTYSALQTFNGGVTIGSLNGVLYGNNGSVTSTATSTATLGLGLSGTLTTLGGSDSLTIATSSLYTGTTGQFPYFSGTNTITATSTISISTSGSVTITRPLSSRSLLVEAASGAATTGGTPNGALSIGNTTGNTGLSIGVLNAAYSYLQSRNLSSASWNDLLLNPISGNVGIATTSPYAKLSVAGETVSELFTATSTNATSTLPNLLATNLRLSGRLYDSANTSGTNGMVLQSTGTSVQWVATSTLGLGGGGGGVTSLGAQFGSALTGALTIASSTTGTDFSITSAASTITFNLPSASATARGLLTSADWSTFNNKISSTSLSGTYPVQYNSGTGAISLAFGTTTSNTWAGTQTFTNAPILGSLTGVLYGNNGTLATQATSTATLGLGLSGSLITLGTSNLTIATSSLYTGTTGQFPYFSGTNTITATSSLFLAADGKVGVGTTTPSASLMIAGRGADIVSLRSTSGLQTGYVDASGNLSLANNGVGTYNFTVDTSGNMFAGGGILRTIGQSRVGIGSSSPWATFAINPVAGGAANQFVIGSSTGTNLVVNNSGFLGIGTTTPGSLLSINGIANFTSASTTFYSSGGINLTGGGCFAINGSCVGGAGGSGTVGSGTTGQFPYYAANGTTLTATSSLFLATSGNIGIGTTSPWGRLSIDGANSDPGGSSPTGILQISDTANTGGILDIGVKAASLPYSWIQPRAYSSATFYNLALNPSGGNVGIGTTTPGRLLTVNGSGQGLIGVDSTSGIGSYVNFLSSSVNRGSIGYSTSGSGGLAFLNAAGSVANLLMTDGGSLGIGTTTPGATLSVQGAGGSLFRVGTGSNYLTYTQQNTNQFGWLANGAGGYVQSWDIANARTSFGGAGTAPLSTVDVLGNLAVGSYAGTVAAPSSGLIVSGNVGIGTSTPGSLFSIGNTNGINFYSGASTTATSTISSNLRVLGNLAVGSGTIWLRDRATSTFSGGINLTSGGCYAINGSCVGGSGGTNFFTNSGDNTYLSTGFRLGVGTSTPFANLSVQGQIGGEDSDAPTAFAVYGGSGGTDIFGTGGYKGGGIILQAGAGGDVTDFGGLGGDVTILAGRGGFGPGSSDGAGGNLLLGSGTGSANGYISLSVGSTEAARFISNGNFGLGTTSPGSILSVNGVANFRSATSTFYGTGGINLTGGGCFAINGVCVGGGGGGSGTVNSGTTGQFPYYAANGTTLTATSSIFLRDNGDIGIGTTTPDHQVTIIGGNSTGMNALFVATSSNYALQGNAALLVVTATSTGDLDYARVAIGTTSPWGGAGIRDQLTVAGRIYSTWRYTACDYPGAVSLNATLVVADTRAYCKDFGFDQGGTTGSIGVNSTSGSYPPFVVMRAAASATGAYAASNAGATFSLPIPAGSASTSPTVEAWVRTSRPTNATTTPLYIVGLTNHLFATALGATQAIPTNGIYFAASSSPNWKAVVRRASVDQAYIDTGIATTTPTGSFQKMRIEVSSSTAIFLINGNVVAQSGVGTGVTLPSVNVKPIVLVQNIAGNSGGTGDFGPRIDIALVRYWLDDPVGGAPPDGVAESSQPGIYDPVLGADIAAAYLADSPSSYLPGMLVAGDLASTSQNDVRKSSKRYDSPLMGVVSTAPRVVLGEETGDTVRVATEGRVPVIVSLENGPILKGDSITSSVVEGVGMKAARAGSTIGRALENFDPDQQNGMCDAALASELQDAGVDLPTDACVTRILVTLDISYSFSVGNYFQDALETLDDIVVAMRELSDDVFDKGVAYTKLVIQQIVAKVAVIENLYAAVITVLPGGEVNLPSGENQMTGTGVMPAGSTELFIENEKVQPGSKIYITLRGLSNTPMAVTELLDGVGFKVQTLEPPVTDLAFDWLMVTTYNAENGTPTAISTSTPIELPPVEETPAEPEEEIPSEPTEPNPSPELFAPPDEEGDVPPEEEPLEPEGSGDESPIPPSEPEPSPESDPVPVEPTAAP